MVPPARSRVDPSEASASSSPGGRNRSWAKRSGSITPSARANRTRASPVFSLPWTFDHHTRVRCCARVRPTYRRRRFSPRASRAASCFRFAADALSGHSALFAASRTRRPVAGS